MTDAVPLFSAGVSPLIGAAERAGATVASATGAVWLAPAPALAYHDTVDTGHGGAPLEIILLIAGAVALGLIALAVLGRKTRKTRVRPGKRTKRTRAPARKRR